MLRGVAFTRSRGAARRSLQLVQRTVPILAPVGSSLPVDHVGGRLVLHGGQRLSDPQPRPDHGAFPRQGRPRQRLALRRQRFREPGVQGTAKFSVHGRLANEDRYNPHPPPEASACALPSPGKLRPSEKAVRAVLGFGPISGESLRTSVEKS